MHILKEIKIKEVYNNHTRYSATFTSSLANAVSETLAFITREDMPKVINITLKVKEIAPRTSY